MQLPSGAPVELGATWFHGICGNPLYEIAVWEGLVRDWRGDPGVLCEVHACAWRSADYGGSCGLHACSMHGRPHACESACVPTRLFMHGCMHASRAL